MSIIPFIVIIECAGCFFMCNTLILPDTSIKWDPYLFYRLCITIWGYIEIYIYHIYPLYVGVSLELQFSVSEVFLLFLSNFTISN